MGLLIDTSAIIAAERGQASWTSLGAEVLGERVAVPAATLAELLVGVNRASAPAHAVSRQRRMDALSSRVPIVPFGAAEARRWAALFAVCQARGALLPATDLAIAATALEMGWGVLVGPQRERHFRSIPELRVEVIG